MAKLSKLDNFLCGLINFAGKIDETMGILHFRMHTMRDVAPIRFKEAKEIYKKSSARKSFHQVVYELKKKNYIKIKTTETGKAIVLDKKGLDRILLLKFRNFKFKKERRKDGKCVMIVFDIPERERFSRDLLREMLYNLGYKIFQQSVWISIYEVEEETKFFLERYCLDRYAKLFLIEERKISF